MKKKVLYGVALTLFSSVAMGTLQSCKDDLSDFKHQYNYDQAGLLKTIAALEAKVDGNKAELQAEIDDLKARVTKNEGDIADLNKELGDLAGKLADYVTLEDLEKRLKDLECNCESYDDQELRNAIAEITTDLSALAGRVDGAEQAIVELNQSVSGLQDKVNANEAAIASIKTDLTNKQNAINEINKALTELKGTVKDQGDAIEALQKKFIEVDGMIEELWLAIEQNQQYMTQMYQSLLAEIDDRFAELTNRLDNFVSSILVQATQSPVFGSLNTPLGIQSNILFGWYGHNDRRAFQFPSSSNTQNYYDGAPALTAAELAALAPEYATVPEGYLGDVNLGKLYLTINPAGNFFSPESFSLETSGGKKYPVTLKVAKSNDDLTFGYTRATIDGNGFYAADVIVKEDDIEAADFDIQPGLKTAVEAALKDPSKRTAVGLLKGVYDQLNGTLPAYAVRYDWTAEGKSNSVFSKYEIAATTAQPLSYSFLYGKSIDKKLPLHGHINSVLERLKEKLGNNLKFTFDNTIEVDGKKITWGGVKDFKEAGDHVEATVYGLTVDGTVYPDFTVDCGTDPETVTTKITDGIIKRIWGDNASDALKADAHAKLTVALLEMQTQINNVVAEINGKVENALDDAFNEADSYAKYVNKIVDLYNKVAGKINNFLADPNHYLQVAMFYNQADSNVGVLSNTLASPTVFNRGNGSVGFYASSYTAELVAPAYMKYVAVTNVYDAATKKVSANSAAEVKAVNAAAKNFNKAMPGKTIRYSIPASSLKADKIYEIVYQGVDYSGRTSTQKFYIQVK